MSNNQPAQRVPLWLWLANIGSAFIMLGSTILNAAGLAEWIPIPVVWGSSVTFLVVFVLTGWLLIQHYRSRAIEAESRLDRAGVFEPIKVAIQPTTATVEDAPLPGEVIRARETLDAIRHSCVERAGADLSESSLSDQMNHFYPCVAAVLSHHVMRELDSLLESRRVIMCRTMSSNGPVTAWVASIGPKELLLDLAGWIKQHPPLTIHDLNPSFALIS